MQKLGFGFMRLPQTDENDWSKVDMELVRQMVDAYLEQGFTYFDTSYVYHMGMSEAAIKQAVVERHPRNCFVIADKMPIWMVQKYEDYQKYFDEQLGRLGVEAIDYYLLHALTGENYKSTQQCDGFAFLRRMKEEGKVKHAGFSYHDGAENLDKILTEHPEVDFVQLQLNYLDWDSETIESRRCHEVAVRHGKPIIVMEPVKGGALAKIPAEAEALMRACHPDWSPASWAIRFAASQKNVMTVLSGMSTMEQLVDNMGYMRDFRPLDDRELEVIEKVRAIILGNPTIPCTACRYCIEDCPKGIPVHKYFSLYNSQKLLGIASGANLYYTTLTQTMGKSSDCIGCRKCENHCPQHLGIVDYLKEVSGFFEAAHA